MKKILSLILIFCMCVILAACTSEKEPKDQLEQIIKNDKLTVGVKADAKPFGYIGENGELQGFDIELAQIITKKLLGSETKLELVPITASNRIIALTSGKVDMVIATMSITRQRQLVVDFSTPYFMAGQAFMVPKNSDIQGLSDLKNKKIIVTLGSTGEKSIKKFLPEAVIQGYKTNIEGYHALKQGKGDAFTTDDTILAGFLSDDNSMKILNKRYTQEPYAVAFRQGEESKNLRDSVNLVIKNMQKTGELNRLKKKWVKY